MSVPKIRPKMKPMEDWPDQNQTEPSIASEIICTNLKRKSLQLRKPQIYSRTKMISHKWWCKVVIAGTRFSLWKPTQCTILWWISGHCQVNWNRCADDLVRTGGESPKDTAIDLPGWEDNHQGSCPQPTGRETQNQNVPGHMFLTQNLAQVSISRPLSKSRGIRKVLVWSIPIWT